MNQGLTVYVFKWQILYLSYNHNDFNITLIFMSLNIHKKNILYKLLHRNIFPSDQYHSQLLWKTALKATWA
jgi:hypothetical protein